jgi:hypothetical protein
MMTHTLVGLANDKPTKIGKSMRSINEITEGGCQSGKGGWLFFVKEVVVNQVKKGGCK